MNGKQQFGPEARPGRQTTANADVAVATHNIEHLQGGMQIHCRSAGMTPPAVEARDQPAGWRPLGIGLSVLLDEANLQWGTEN